MKKDLKMISLMILFFIIIISIPKGTYSTAAFTVSEFGFLGPVIEIYSNKGTANIITALNTMQDIHILLGNLIFSIVLSYCLTYIFYKYFIQKNKSNNSHDL